jgi:hypothetical protein
MNFKDKLNEAEILKSNGKSIEFIINDLYTKQTHYIEAINIIMVVFDIERDNAENKLFLHEHYKKMQNEINPFTQDFLDNNY